MKNHSIAFGSRLCWAMTSFALVAVLPGCSGSLAVESPAPPQTPVVTSEERSTPESATEKNVTTTPQVTPEKPAEPTATVTTGLQPKLTKVDPAQLVGQWKDSFFGTRTLVLKPDGTAKMILDLDFTGRLLYGKRLEFDMVWSVDGAVVTIDILSGHPEKSAKSAMNTWGERYVYLLDCVEDHQVEMRDSDGSMSHVLRRVPDETSTP
ncbi:MAG: hypothetical protein WCJ09_07080 [Planctomycetota bacterium]